MENVTVYTIDEIREMFPETYEVLYERWQEQQAVMPIPWADEVIDSMKSVIEACGGELRDYSICEYASMSSIKVSVDDEDDEDDRPKDADWLWENVLFGLGYETPGEFPGLYLMTGYCADDAMLESVYVDLKDGCTLTEALENLAVVAAQQFEEERERQLSEDEMLEVWGDRHFTEDGRPVD